MKYLLKRSDYLLLEFVDIAKKILDEKNIDKNDERFLKIKEITKSNPSYIGLLTHYVFNTNEPIEEVERVFGLIKRYSQLLKNNNLNPLELIEYKNYLDISIYASRSKKYVKSIDEKVYRYFFLEELEDYINNLIVNNDKIKFVNKFISNKYKHLVNEQTIELFYELKRLGEKLKWDNIHSKIQSLLTDKLLIFKSTEELNNSLRTTIDQITGGWNVDSIKEMVQLEGAEVVYSDDRFVIVDIKESKAIVDELGSPKWCIVYSDSHFKNYVKFPNKQYIVYDTDMDISDKKSMIGVTIEKGLNNNVLGKFNTAHDRADGYIPESYFIELGIREYLKPMSIENIRKKSKELGIVDLIKYKLTDEVINRLENGEIDIKENLDNIVKNAVKYDTELFKYLKDNYDIKISHDEIHSACQFGNLEVLEYICDNGLYVDKDSDLYILSAIGTNKFNIVKYLIENKLVPVHISLYDPIFLSIDKQNGLEYVKLLTEYGMDPSRSNNHSLKKAIKNGKEDIVEFLLKQPKVIEKLTDEEKEKYNIY